RTCLEPLASAGRGSSLRIARALVMAEPPSVGQGEITAKGNLNNKKMLARPTRSRRGHRGRMTWET
ncbi:MAG: hypothetical protein AAFP78_00575, partial [Pseudomonadota bacterium]